MHYNRPVVAQALLVAVISAGCKSADRPVTVGGNESTADAEVRAEIADHTSPQPAPVGVQTAAVLDQDPSESNHLVAVRDGSAAKPADGKTKAKQTRALYEHLLFFPNKYPEGNWSPKDVNPEDCHFEADDGVKLHGWYLPHPQARAVVLYAHGNAGNVALWSDVLRVLHHRLQVSVLLFDYRGYGRSEGIPTVGGAQRDIRAAREFLVKRAGIPASEIVLWGRSLGGGLVIDLAAKDGAKGLIFESTFSSLRDVAQIHYPKMLVNLLVADELNSAESIEDYHGPLLQSHGTNDRTIPLSLGRKLFDAANEPKQFVPIQGADHNHPMTEDYLQVVDEFLNRMNRGAP